MAGIRLEWAQFGDFDSFDVIRSLTSMVGVADEDLPRPIVTGLTTMYYADTTVVHGNVYYYKIRAWRDSVEVVSEQLITQAGDPHFANVVSLLHFNDNITDEKGKTWVRYGSSATYTTGAVAGNKAIVNTNGCTQTNHHSDFNFGSGDFTIECFIKFNRVSYSNEWMGVFGKQYDNPDRAFAIHSNPSSSSIHISVNMSDNSNVMVTTSDLTVGQWHHIAICRDGTTLRYFVDGTVVHSATVGSLAVRDNSKKLTVGSIYESGYYPFGGAIDEFRITKGVARYTANFTPPIAPFPNS